MTSTAKPRVQAATRSQVSAWFHEHVAGIPWARVALAGLTRAEIPAEDLATALSRLAGRHPALRSTFRLSDHRLERAELPAAAVPAAWMRPRMDRRSDPAASGEDELAALVDDEHDRTFDLTAGPLIRVAVADRGGARVLSAVAHGSVCDRPALHLLVGELADVVLGTIGRRATHAAAPATPAVPALVAAYAKPFGDYLVRRYQGPADSCRVRARVMPTGRDIPAPLRDRVERSAAAMGTDVTAVVLAALALVLARHRGLTEVCLGVHHQPDGQVTGSHASDDPVPILVAVTDRQRARDLVSQVATKLRRAGTAGFPRLSAIADNLSLPARLGPAIPVDARCSVIALPWPSSLRRVVTKLAVDTVLQVDVRWPDGADRAHIDMVPGDGPDQPDVVDILVRDVITALSWLSGRSRPSRTVSQLISARDRQLVAKWSSGPPAAPSEASRVHELFERRVAEIPQRLAVIAGDVSLTYRELDQRAGKLASYLAAGAGVRAGAVVGVVAERTDGLVTALLAAWKCGAAYLPIDVSTPAARVGSLMRDVGAEVLLVPSTKPALSEIAGMTMVAMADCLGDGKTQAATPPCLPHAADALAYVIFTSGSSGRPKAVAVPHSAVLNVLASMDAYLVSDTRPCWLATTNVCFDISVIELFWTLTRGGTVMLAADGAPDHLAGRADAANMPITHYQATPSLLSAAVDDEQFRRGLGEVSTLISAGEPLARDLANRLLECHGGGRLINGYGPTETTVYATCATIAAESRPVTIGRPLAGVTIWILGDSGDPVPPGLTGELCVGGSAVAWGYLGQGGLTAARFRPDPFSSVPGTRLYWTGDLARYSSDGQVEYLGRRDRQVKIRGFRVEPGEVESVLLGCAGIRSATVVAREDRAGERRLVGYAIPADLTADPAVVERTLLDEARARLPAYLVPSRIVVLTKLPLGPGGKLDPARLPAPGPRKPGAGFGECLATVTRLWARALGCRADELTPDTAPYHRGATLVHAAQVYRELDLEYPSAISPSELAVAATLRDLAGLIDDRRRCGDGQGAGHDR